jgi:hypothetical protein
MQIPDTPLFVKTQDFLVWLIRHTQRFPKNLRHSYTQRLELLALDFQEGTLMANACRGDRRREWLEKADGKFTLYDHTRRIGQRGLRRFNRTLRRLKWRFRHGLIGAKQVGRSLRAWQAHIGTANSTGVRRDLWRKVRFGRTGLRVPRGSGQTSDAPPGADGIYARRPNDA